jgi:hypothetical protein
LFLLLSFLQSIENQLFYLPQNQSSAGHPQAGAASIVQPAKKALASTHPSRGFRRCLQ